MTFGTAFTSVVRRDVPRQTRRHVVAQQPRQQQTAAAAPTETSTNARAIDFFPTSPFWFPGPWQNPMNYPGR